MALLSRKVDYALLILSYLHHRPEGGCVRVIADRFGLKKAFAANVLKLLCHRGLVSSHRGIHGGYVLARRAEEIRLAELLDLMGEPFHLLDCNRTAPGGFASDEASCALEAICPVRSAIGEVDRRIRAVLETVSLAELFRGASPRGTCTQYGLEVSLPEPVFWTGENDAEQAALAT
jgi:Rrf2 family protein